MTKGTGSMRVQVHPHDKAPLDWGLAKIHKMAENVVKMSTFIRCESSSAARHSAACERAKTFLTTVAERAEGFTGEVDVPDDVREVLFTAAVAWLRECNDKIIPGQTSLTIGVTDAEKRKHQVESLRDRLEGIIGIFDRVGTEPAAPATDGDDDDDADDDGDSLWDQGPEAHRTQPADAAAANGDGKVTVPESVATAAAGRKGKGLA